MKDNQDIIKIPNCRVFVSVHLDVSKKKEVLLYLAKCLCEEGCVKRGYAQAVLKREQEYPTGLKLEGSFNIALTHAGPEHVYKNAIIVGVLDQPVQFQLMGEPDQTIPVRVVFMFSAIDYDSINYYIEKLVEEVLLKPKVIAWMIEINDEDQIYSFLSQILFGYDSN